MDAALVGRVWQRAASRCEYCGLPADLSALPFEIDHVVARSHGGRTVASNLALSCYYCNRYKGPNVAGFDPRSGDLTRLFHPRRHKWATHFQWEGVRLVGRTAVGRLTCAVLQINHPDAVAVRDGLLAEGLFP